MADGRRVLSARRPCRDLTASVKCRMQNAKCIPYSVFRIPHSAFLDSPRRLQVRREALGGGEFRARRRDAAGAAERQRQLKMRLRVVGRQTNRLAKLRDRAAYVLLLQPLQPGVDSEGCR